MTQEKHNKQDIEKFHELLGHKNQTEIRLIAQKVGKEQPKAQSEFANSKEEFADICIKNSGIDNVYAGLNERCASGTTAKDVITINLVGIDLDCKTKPATEEDILLVIETAKSVSNELKERFDTDASIDLSGNGCHVLQPIPITEVTDENRIELNEKIKQFCRELNKKYETNKIKIDTTGDLPRVFRVTGTYNLKFNSISKFLVYNGRQESQKLLDYILSIKIEEELKEAEVSELIDIENESERTFEDFEGFKIKDFKLKMLYDGNNLEFPSRSEADMAFMLKLLWYGFSKNVIWEIFNKSKREKWNESPDAYKELLYKKGLGFIKGKIRQAYSRFFKNLQEVKEVDKNIIILSDDTFTWDELKELMTEKYFEGEGFNLFLNRRITLKGKITNKIYDYKNNICIAYNYIYKDDEGNKHEDIIFLDEIKNLKYRRTDNSFVFDFYIYLFIHKNQKYFVLTKNELETAEYELMGVEVKILDKINVGDKATFSTDTNLLFLAEAIPTKPLYQNHEELIKSIAKYDLNHDKLFNYILSNKNYKSRAARQPKEIEKLVGAVIFSSKEGFDGYPLNPLVFGPQSTLKSSMIEAVHQKLDGEQDIVEGSGSTIKALIPSFKGVIAEPGAFIKATRFLFVDEFLRLLMRSPADERNVLLTSLNPLLEHKEREFGSGNSKMRARATAKFFAVTNPVYGTNSIADLLSNFAESDSFISRLLVWYYNKEEKEFSRNKKNIEDNYFKIENSHFLGILDYLQSFESKFDEEKVLSIHKQFLIFLPSKIRDMYEGRYQHHILCLMDGVIKQRCLLEKDTSFTANESDYDTLYSIWRTMIDGWISIDLKNVNEKDAVKYLTREEAYVYELVKKTGVFWDYQLETKFKEEIPNYKEILVKLASFNLIKIDGRKYGIPGDISANV